VVIRSPRAGAEIVADAVWLMITRKAPNVIAGIALIVTVPIVMELYVFVTTAEICCRIRREPKSFWNSTLLHMMIPYFT
jgi:hypothetical protein